jgi:hypothetical protein
MPYLSELGTGQKVYLDNQGNQTIVTISSSSPGQQQQASSSFTTGSWTATPEVLQTPTGIILKIYTATGEQLIQLQGGSMSMVNSTPGNIQQLQVQQTSTMPSTGMKPMEPMKPMDPMKPMEMRMGNMSMSMGCAIR